MELLGGGGIICALGGITATFVRLGRLLERLDDIEDRMRRLEQRQDNIRSYRRLN